MSFPDLDPSKAPALGGAHHSHAETSPQPPSVFSTPIVPTNSKRGGLLRSASGLAKGGFGVIAVIILAQLLLEPQYKPAHLYGTLQGAIDKAELNEKKYAQAEFDEAIALARAEAERSTAAKYEAQLASVRSELEITASAYQTLYQRSNIMAQGMLQMQQTLLQYRQQAVASTQGGARLVGNLSSFMCGLSQLSQDGDSGGYCARTREIQQGIASELNSVGAVSQTELMEQIFGGLPDPATMRVQRAETPGIAPSPARMTGGG